MKNKNKDKNSGELLDHDFDGIKEKNNPTPTWFNLLLYGSIIFAVLYMGYYHVYQDGQPLLQEEAASMGKANQSSDNNFNYAAASKNPEIIAQAKEVYGTNCASCHGAHAEGGVGPNLVDDYWLHGSTFKDVNHVISEGVLSKGMPGWKNILGPKKINELVAYIASLQGTNPANAKKAEGTPGKLH